MDYEGYLRLPQGVLDDCRLLMDFSIKANAKETGNARRR